MLRGYRGLGARVQAESRLHAHGRPAAGDLVAGRGARHRRAFPDAARARRAPARRSRWLGRIEAMQRPALVIAHNKTLAAQLCNEFREFFPENAVEYFVSYYDYYQPEAYVPAQDLYIEKDSSINDEIDRLRHSATAALLARRDVVIVASVSCIYGIGSPELYREQMQLFKVGDWVDRDETFRKLIGMQYARNDTNLTRGTFRVKGEVLEVFPAYAETAYRIALFGDEVESIQHFDPLTGEVLDEIDHVAVWPATHYVTKEETIERSVAEIKHELNERVAFFEESGKLLEAHRLRQRTEYDMELTEGAGLRARDRELLADPRRPARGQPAAHAHRLLPRRLRRLRRRVAPDDPAARRDVRGRPLAQADPRGPRLPPAVGARQPAAPLRGVPEPDRPDGDGVGDARASSSGPPPRGSSSRSSGPTGIVDPEVERARDAEPDRRPDERGPPPRGGRRAHARDHAHQEDGRGPHRVPARARLPGAVPALGDRHARAHPDHPRPAARRIRRARGREPAPRGPRPARGLAGWDPRRRQGGLPARRDEPDPDDRPGGAKRARPGAHVRRPRDRRHAGGDP